MAFEPLAPALSSPSPRPDKPQRQGHSVKRQILGLLCAAAALVAPVAAQAAHSSHAHGGSSASNDVLCLAFSMSAANSQDQKTQVSGLVGMGYYLGRIEASGAHIDLQQRIDAEIASKKGQNLGALAHACVETLANHIAGLNPINQHLAAEFGAKQPAPGSAPAATPQQPMVLKPIPSPQSH
jgi:hypothetical protein